VVTRFSHLDWLQQSFWRGKWHYALCTKPLLPCAAVLISNNKRHSGEAEHGGHHYGWVSAVPTSEHCVFFATAVSDSSLCGLLHGRPQPYPCSCFSSSFMARCFAAPCSSPAPPRMAQVGSGEGFGGDTRSSSVAGRPKTISNDQMQNEAPCTTKCLPTANAKG
jgi:hypothetical protein